ASLKPDSLTLETAPGRASPPSSATSTTNPPATSLLKPPSTQERSLTPKRPLKGIPATATNAESLNAFATKALTGNSPSSNIAPANPTFPTPSASNSCASSNPSAPLNAFLCPLDLLHMRLYPIINRSPNPLKPPARPPSRAQIHRAAFPHLSQIQFQLPLTG